MPKRNTPRSIEVSPAPTEAKTNFLARRVARLGDPPAVKAVVQIDFQDPAPPNFLALAVITSPIGLAGLVRARPISEGKRIHPQGTHPQPRSALSTVGHIWLHHPRGWRATKILSSAPRGAHFCLELSCSSDRTTAESLVGTRLGVSRTEESDDLYWSDLIGREVETVAGEHLGEVERLETNGQHDWLVVGKHFIPLVDRHVVSLGKKGSPVVVDWQSDWL